MKLKFKFLITTFVLFLLLLNSLCFATNSNSEIMLISDTNQTQKTDTSDLYSDLYIADESEYEIKDTINGNSFISVDTLNITPNSNGGIIQGNLFVTADNVNIKSDVIYSDTEKDELGNPVISINKYSTVSGNVFVMADKFILEPGCQINGDLYICANEVYLEQKSKINGNIFVCANIFELNSDVGESVYATTSSFDMKYFGFISRDLYLSAEETILNGWIYRDSFITAKNIVTQDKFINQGNFTIKDANNLTFSGEILGYAKINSKNINFKNKDNDKNLTCKIAGNLSYSSNQEIQVPEGIVLKEISYSNYNSIEDSKNILSTILDYVLNLIGMLILAHVLYVLIHKFAPKYLDKISNITVLGLLKYLGIGLGFLILFPIVSILLLITSVGSILGIILLLIYIILLLLAKPMFIISVATFAKNKYAKKLNTYLYILLIDVILSLITLIPYIEFIISMLVSLIGFGILITNSILRKK